MQLENFIRHNDFNAIKIALVNNEAAIALDLFNRISFQQQVNLAQNHGHHVASLAIRAQCPGLVTGIFAAATGATKSQLLEQDNYILAELPLLFNNRASFAILWSAANLAQKRGIIAAFPEVILHAAGWRDLDLVQQAFYIMDRDLREPTLLAHQGYLFTDPAHEATNQDRALARWVWTVAPDNVKEYFITSTNAMGRPLFEFCTTHASEELRFMIYDKALHWQIPEKKAAMLRAISYETIMPYRSYNWAENFRTITQNAVSLPSGLTAHPLNIEAAYKISQYTCAKITWQDFALLMDIQRLSITAKGAGGAAKELYNKATDIAAKQDPEGVTRGESYFWAAASILLNPANAALKQEFNVQRSTFSTSVTGNDQPNLEQTPKSNKRRRIEMPATPQMFNRHLPSENPHTPRGRDMALNLSESFDQRHI